MELEEINHIHILGYRGGLRSLCIRKRKCPYCDFDNMAQLEVARTPSSMCVLTRGGYTDSKDN